MRNLLSSYFATTSIIYQYTATLIPFIFISSVYGLKKILTFPIPKKYPNAIITSVLIIGLIFSWILGPQLQVINNIYAFTHNPDYLDYIRRYFIPLVPRGASVVATFDFLTKLSCREKLYTFHYIYFGREKVEKKKFLLPKDTEYALIDFQDFATFYVFYTPEGAENIRRFLEEGNWGIVKIIDSIALLKRNYVSNYKLYESVGQPHMQNKKEMDMDNQLTFLGYDTKKDSIDRKCILNLSLYWKCKEKISKDFTMIITISDPEKKFVLQKPQELCYNIYRTSEWKSGEVIKGNYWIYLPLINHLTEYLVNITILDKKGKAVSNINFNS
jgi:hypothetical protein